MDWRKLTASGRWQVDDTDYDSVYLFMDACPRAGSGKWIHQLRLSLKMSRISRMSAKAAIENNNTAAASSAASANDGHEDEVPPPPPVKNRYLQKQLSDSSSGQEEKTLWLYKTLEGFSTNRGNTRQTDCSGFAGDAGEQG